MVRWTPTEVVLSIFLVSKLVQHCDQIGTPNIEKAAQ